MHVVDFDFKNWLEIELSPVTCAGKTGELLSVPKFRGQKEVISELVSNYELNSVELCSCPISSKWLFFKRDSAEEVLKGAAGEILSEDLGYAEITVEGFVQELKERWANSGAIPHEVGFLLGYPAADVAGFMGLSDKPCLGCCGWQVFGDLKAAKDMSDSYQQAKQAARLAVCA